MSPGAAVREATAETDNGRLAVFATAGRALLLIRQNLLLHAKAIWPPIVFLVPAEFLYHKAIGNAEHLSDKLQAALSAPWWMLIAASLAWLTGLKILLSFSISWRRHLLLGEKFDPFFFKAPFWKYLGFLLLTYAWLLPLLGVAGLPAAATLTWTAAIVPAIAIVVVVWRSSARCRISRC